MTPKEVSESMIQRVNAYFRDDNIGNVMIEHGYWKKNNVERNEAKC
ncbi:MAG: hypothetical protein WC489_07930 [Patescibacteria group bacterium]|jgi:hypothetical protein